jgi:DNA-binding transcriptional LysR family regulator
MPHARAMRDAAARIGLAAAGRSETLQGTVRITASRVVANFVLPDILVALRLAEPGIDIELVASDASENLLFHEADIAVRMYRPTQLDVVTRHVCDLPMGLYAARSYLDRKGRPETAEELAAHDFVGFDRSDLILQIMRSFGMDRRREDFPVRCDDQIVYWALVRAGWGIGGMQCLIGNADPAVERIAPMIVMPALPVWLTAPEALRQTPRIRRVYDHLAKAFAALPG